MYVNMHAQSSCNQIRLTLLWSIVQTLPNLGRSQRYKKVQVLLLFWITDDLFILPELEDLEQCFRDDYHFDTTIFPIPSENSHLELLMKIGSTIKEEESNETLFIIYYGGNARIDARSQTIWSA